MNLQHFVDKMLTLKGAIAAAIVDFESGMLMASGSNDPAFDLEVVAARGSEVMRAKIKTMQKLEMGRRHQRHHDYHHQPIPFSLPRQTTPQYVHLSCREPQKRKCFTLPPDDVRRR